jgi:hypothetical protein
MGFWGVGAVRGPISALQLILVMMSNNEVSALRKITKRQKGSFQQVEESYFSAFKDTISLFNAATFLCELLVGQVRAPSL